MGEVTKRQSKYWVFTINNPDKDIDDFDKSKIEFMIYQYEIGKEGTEHIQGYVVFKRPIRFNTIHNMVPRAHWETRMGTHKQCVDYCSKLDTRKEGTEPVIYGTITEKPQRETNNSGKISKSNKGGVLIDLKALLDEGVPMKEVADEHFSSFLRFGKMFHTYRTITVKPRNFKTVCIVIYGPTKTGKSKWCLDNFPDAYWNQKVNGGMDMKDKMLWL